MACSAQAVLHGTKKKWLFYSQLLGAASYGWQSELQGLKAFERVVCPALPADTAWAPAHYGTAGVRCMPVGVVPQLNARHFCNPAGVSAVLCTMCALLPHRLMCRFDVLLSASYTNAASCTRPAGHCAAHNTLGCSHM